MAKNFNLRNIEANYKRVLVKVPGMLGNEAVNFFKDSFRLQGFLGARLEPWRKRRSRKRAGRAILVKSGRLRRSPRIASNSGGIVRIGTDVPYAKAHNEGYRGVVNVPAHSRGRYTKSKEGRGIFSVKTRKERMRTVKTKTGTIQVRAHTKRMNLPKRQFMGYSPYLDAKLKRLLQAELLKGLR